MLFRTVIEVLGKPKEHVENALKSYLEKIKEDKNYSIKNEDLAELKKQENELWATFAELEIETEDPQNLVNFCFDYMPSMIEVLSPSKIEFTDKEVTDLFNDLQARLHHVDMVAKQVKLENDHLKQNSSKLLRNYLAILLGKNELTLQQLSVYTGVKEDKLGDYLDSMIDEGIVLMEGDVYKLNKEKLKKE